MKQHRTQEEKMEERLQNAEYLSKTHRETLDLAIDSGSELGTQMASHHYVLSLLREGNLHKEYKIGNPSDFYLRAVSVANEHGLKSLEEKASHLLANYEVDKAMANNEVFNKMLSFLNP